MDKITVGIATIPSRENSLKQVIKSLQNQTVKPDVIYVYLNNYSEIPFFLRRENIKVFQGEDLGDAGKFYMVGQVKGIYLSCDDDILYPPNYIETIISGLRKYDYKRIVSFHGSIFNEKINNFYRDRKLISFKRELKHDVQVHTVGTGVAAFNTNIIKLSVDDFLIPNCADVWLGLQAQKQQIPMTVLAHKEKWLKPIANTTINSIFQRYIRDESKIKGVTKIVNSVKWKLY